MERERSDSVGRERQRPDIRQTMLARRDALGRDRRCFLSGRIHERLDALPEVRQSRILFVYVGFRSEVETMGLIETWLARGRRVVVPLTLVAEKRLLPVEIRDPATELAPGYCSIPEPRADLVAGRVIEPALIETVIVPGSVFDRRGGRMGYGGGYYDRFLSMEAPRALRIGLAFSCQLTDEIALQPHDQKMDILVTEEGMYRFAR